LAEIIEDIVEGARFDLQPGSFQLTRAFYVGGIIPTMDALIQAFKEGGANGVRIPYMTAPHPTVAGIVASSYSCVPVKNSSRTGVMVYVYYSQEWLVEVVGDSSLDTTSTWPAGHPLVNLPILIPYCSTRGSRFTLPIDPRGLNTDPTRNGGTFYDIGRVTRLSDKVSLQFTHIEGKSPLTLSQQYRGKINSVTWQGGAPSTWICRGIDGVTVPQPWGFTMWRNTYLMSHDPKTWSSSNAYTATLTGKPPPDAIFDPADPLSGNGMFLIPDGATIDFNALGLPNAL
jgi:hypothetical protein